MKFFTNTVSLLYRVLRHLFPLTLLLFTVAACGIQLPESKPKLPLDMQAVIPKDWVTLGQLNAIDVDGDNDDEWLLFYRYDVVTRGNDLLGPIGGVIFDAQTDKVSGASMLVPYKLLPDYQTGKGQGFLGERRCDVKMYDSDGDGQKDELAVFGYGYEPAFPTYLTIFRWQGTTPARGYRVVAHFFGDGGITVEQPDPREAGAISRVMQKNRLNERSLLSRSTVYARQADGYVVSQSSLEFTYAVPKNPYYPEAVVLAYYLLRNRGQADEAQQYLLSGGEVGQVQASIVTAAGALPSTEFSLPSSESIALPVMLSYSGDAVVQGQAAGSSLPSTTYGAMSYVDVTVQVIESGQTVNRIWRVVNVPSAGCQAEVCWRLLGQR